MRTSRHPSVPKVESIQSQKLAMSGGLKLELAKTIEPMQDSRIHIERIDGPFPFPLKVGTGI